MAISPWIPAAAQIGSLAFSGIGSWLGSRDQQKYQEDIRRMQEDARKRMAEAQKAASQRANYLSILTGERVAPNPVDVDLPVIPAYKPGTMTTLMSGLGKGLGYAAQGASAFQKAQTYSEQLAAQQGKQAAIADAWEAYNTAPKSGSVYYDPSSGLQKTNALQRSQAVLDSLGQLTDDEAYTKATNDGTVFTGLFSGDSDKTFKSSYAATLLDVHGKAQTQHDANSATAAQIEIARQKLAIQQKTADATIRASRISADADRLDNINETRAYITEQMWDDPNTRKNIARLDMMHKALNLVHSSIGDEFIVGPDGQKYKNPEWLGVYNDDGSLKGYHLKGLTADALIQVYQRTRDEGVVHADDVNRIRQHADSFFGSIGTTFESWYRSFTTEGSEPLILGPEQINSLVTILEIDRDYLAQALYDNSMAVGKSVANTFGDQSDAGIFSLNTLNGKVGWDSREGLLSLVEEEIRERLNYQPKVTNAAGQAVQYDSNAVTANLVKAASDTPGVDTTPISDPGTPGPTPDVVDDFITPQPSGKYATPPDAITHADNRLAEHWNDYFGKGTVLAESFNLARDGVEAVVNATAGTMDYLNSEGYNMKSLHGLGRHLREKSNTQGMVLRPNFPNPRFNPEAGPADFATYYLGRGAETILGMADATIGPGGQENVARTAAHVGNAITEGVAERLTPPLNSLNRIANYVPTLGDTYNQLRTMGSTIGAGASSNALNAFGLAPPTDAISNMYDTASNAYNSGNEYLMKVLTDPALWGLISAGRKPYGTGFPTAGGVRPPSGLGGQ